jgi:hypothetical protein
MNRACRKRHSQHHNLTQLDCYGKAEVSCLCTLDRSHAHVIHGGKTGQYRIEDAEVCTGSIWQMTHHQTVRFTAMLMDHNDICVVIVPC